MGLLWAVKRLRLRERCSQAFETIRMCTFADINNASEKFRLEAR